MVAKVYMQRAMEAFRCRFPTLHVDLWIDDCSFDVVERLLSIGKTGFVVSNAEAQRLLTDTLPRNGPKIHDVMRDLGCDCTSGRLRRIMTMKSRRRRATGGRKGKKLHKLKIIWKAVRLRL